MLTGESVPQVKESLALVDQDQLGSQSGVSKNDGYVNLGSDNNVDATWRRHLVFGGTNILQHTMRNEGEGAEGGEVIKNAEDDKSLSFASKARNALQHLPIPPDQGCVALVVRTAFGTTQGGLMRKILFATERVSANSGETFYFIGVLIIFAIIASATVLREGLMDENRNKFRLALHCIMILTSVVPPELPMELSLAVTNSLATLSRGLVFCTEPFRIPYAGKLDILCFDKTGTLTMDKMVLKGVVGPIDPVIGSLSNLLSDDNKTTALPSHGEKDNSAISVISDPLTCSEVTLSIMAACHSLLVAPETGAIVGDPLEITTMESSGFQFINESVLHGTSDKSKPSTGLSLTCVVHQALGVALKVKHRYPFSSALKRMSTIVEGYLPGENKAGLFVFTKGAPEVLAAHMKDIPSFYQETYLHHMARGKRVLTLAYRHVPVLTTHTQTLQDLKDSVRSKVETGLIFAGFLIFDCDLKADSKSVVKELLKSAHRVVMITGDSAYTAANVGDKLGMTKTGAETGVLILEENEASTDKASSLVWRKVSSGTSTKGKNLALKVSEHTIPFNGSADMLKALAMQYTLCVTGPSLSTYLIQLAVKDGGLVGESDSLLLKNMCPHVTIFARVSPAQKETIVLALNDSGLYTLMCGDGTNDVGALKAAHVGVSIGISFKAMLYPYLKVLLLHVYFFLYLCFLVSCIILVWRTFL